MLEPKNQIETIHLFPKVNVALIELLKSLTYEQWLAPTVLPGRTVKDIASHILDGSLRNLSLQRDNHVAMTPDISSYQDLVDYIQMLNKTWIDVSKRLSPQILITLLETSETMFYEFKRTLDPQDKAIFAVSWAGEDESQNWFDIAREYTEKWHHQAQIRLAVNKPGIESKELLYPVLDTFMRGIPHAYRNEKITGTIAITITGQAGGSWFLHNAGERWQFTSEATETPITIITLPDLIAWRLFTDSIDQKEALKHIEISGDKKRAQPLLSMTTVMR